MITFKLNRFHSVNGEEEEEVKCGWCWEGIGDGLSMFVLVLFLFFVYGIVLDVCLFDFDFSGDYVIELIEE